MVEITSFVDEGLGNSSHVLDLGDGRAAVFDPPRDVSPLRRWAAEHGRVLSHAFETHLHADFVSGSRELASLGASIAAPASADLAFPHRGLVDGDELDLGGLRLQAMATPGHAPEHMGYVIADGSRPVAFFSGGALLPGGMARTDLISPDQTEAFARSLYRVLHERILALPDGVIVYPTHGGGSFCATSGGSERTTTIGRERATNPLLAAPDEDSFVTRLMAGFGSYPAYFRRLREVNRRGPRVYGATPMLARLSVADVETLMLGDADVIDVRPIEAFAAGHIPNSLSIALRPEFASWLGWLVSADRPLVFILGADQDRADLVRQALGIGYEHLAGELEDGIDAWQGAGRPRTDTPITQTVEPSTPVVDVRQAAEFEAGHVPGAVSIELGSLRSVATESLPSGAVFMCGHGQRAMTGASLAERAGHPGRVFRGSADDWARASGQRLAVGR